LVITTITAYIIFFNKKVISIDVTADGKPELEQPLLDNKGDKEKGEKTPRTTELVKSLKHIAGAIDDVIKILIFTYYVFDDLILRHIQK